MRILQISHNHHVNGGSDAVYFATSRLLRQAGHEVIPFCMASTRNEATRWSKYFPDGADTKTAPLRDTLSYFYNRDAARKLDLLLDAAGPIDVAHLHIYHGKQTPAILPVLKRRGIGIIQSLHEYKLACPVYTMQRGDEPCEKCIEGGSWNAVLHRCKDKSLVKSFAMTAEFHIARLLGDIRHVDRFLCVSDFQKGKMRRAGIPAEKLFTLHNFVETGVENAPAIHPPFFLFAGRLERLKGIRTLMDAFSKLPFHLKIAGTGSLAAEVRDRAALMPNVEFLGFQPHDEMARLLNQSLGSIVPSEWYENCPMSVLEAMAASRPVIGARIGGIPELIRDGTDGFLFEPGNAKALARAVHKLFHSDPEKMGTAALEACQTRFSKDTHLASLLTHYRAVVKHDNQVAAE